MHIRTTNVQWIKACKHIDLKLWTKNSFVRDSVLNESIKGNKIIFYYYYYFEIGHESDVHMLFLWIRFVSFRFLVKACTQSTLNFANRTAYFRTNNRLDEWSALFFVALASALAPMCALREKNKINPKTRMREIVCAREEKMIYCAKCVRLLVFILPFLRLLSSFTPI